MSLTDNEFVPNPQMGDYRPSAENELSLSELSRRQRFTRAVAGAGTREAALRLEGCTYCCDAILVNHKKVQRVYRELGLTVKRTRRKRLERVFTPRPVLMVPNQEWSVDL